MPSIPDTLAAPRGRALRVAAAALLAFSPLVDGGTTHVPAALIRLGALALGVGWLWQASGGRGHWRAATPFDLPVVFFMALAAVSTVASPDRYQSLQGFLSLAAWALVLAAAAEVAREPGGRSWLVGTITAGGVLQAALALGQLALSPAGRPAGTYFNPNHLALALAMTGAILLALEPRSAAGRWGRWGALLLAACALVATGSRGGVLAAAAGWGFVAWRRWRWRAAAAAAGLALALATVPNPLADRVRSLGSTDPYAYTRVRIWASAIERGLDRPLGVGLNLFRQSSQRYAFPMEDGVARYARRAESAHNDYLQVFAELGFPGLVLALWGGAALVLAARRALGDPALAGDRPLIAGAAGALCAAAAQALVDTPLHVPGLLVPAAALAGVLAAGGRTTGPVETPALVGRAPRRRARLALLALGAVAAAGVARHGLAYAAYQRAVSERHARGPQAAIPWLERAERLAPGSAVYADAAAAAALAAFRVSGDPRLAARAEEGMRRALALDPADALRRDRLARVYREIVPADPGLRREALRRADALYAEAERLDPYGAPFPFERAEVLALLGDEDGAIAALERAVALEPRFLPARLRLARMRAARGEREAARAQYDAIEATLAAYEAAPPGPADRGLAARFLAVDREAVRHEAAALATGRAG